MAGIVTLQAYTICGRARREATLVRGARRQRRTKHSFSQREKNRIVFQLLIEVYISNYIPITFLDAPKIPDHFESISRFAGNANRTRSLEGALEAGEISRARGVELPESVALIGCDAGPGDEVLEGTGQPLVSAPRSLRDDLIGLRFRLDGTPHCEIVTRIASYNFWRLRKVQKKNDRK